MKIALLAGEISGDQLGSAIAEELYKSVPNVTLIGITGENMRNSGVRSIANINMLSVVGFSEIILKLPKLLWFRYQIFRQLIYEKPDFVIGIDSPDFNLSLLKKLRIRGIRTIQFVAPTVWAWRKWRIKKIKDSVEKLLCLYPFEVDFFSKHNISAIYVGHPIADKIPIDYDLVQYRKQMRVEPNKLIIALLPGSRESEIIRHSQILLNTASTINQELNPLGTIKKQTHQELRRSARIVTNFNSLIPNNPNETLSFFNQSPLQFVVPLPTIETFNLFKDQTSKAITSLPIRIMRGHAKQAIALADICLIASGTACLEAALYKKPMVIFYKLNKITLRLMKWLYQLPWFGLPNILAKKFIVPEILLNQATEKEMAEEVLSLLEDKKRCQKIVEEFNELHKNLIVDRQKIWQGILVNQSPK